MIVWVNILLSRIQHFQEYNIGLVNQGDDDTVVQNIASHRASQAAAEMHFQLELSRFELHSIRYRA